MRARQETSGTQTNLYLQPEDGTGIFRLEIKNRRENPAKLSAKQTERKIS